MIPSSQRILPNPNPNPATSPPNPTHLQLQGQCKIHSLTLLKFQPIKAIILTILAVMTIVGFFLLFYYKWVRRRLWFGECGELEATHVYVDGGKGNDQIGGLEREDGEAGGDGGDRRVFYFRKLKYRLLGATPTGYAFVPVAYDYQLQFPKIKSTTYLQTGRPTPKIPTLLNFYGPNTHPVQVPTYPSYMLQTLLKPFFLLQYLVCIAYFIEGYLVFTILNLGFSVITSTINYVLTYFSYRKIKDMAQVEHAVRVVRDGVEVELRGCDLVPGDLVVVEDGEICCDCVLVAGQVYVNQASLTGESVPIAKSAVTNVKNIDDHIYWLYQGSKIVQKRGKPLALVVCTGFSTRRGRIIRKILTKVPVSSQIFKKAFLFLMEAFAVAMIIYFATLGFVLSKEISGLIVGFRFVDFLGWSFPPTFPIYFNVAYSSAVVRLKHNSILCTQPQKTVQPSNLQYLCFDKTGTLTQPTVQIHKVYKFTSNLNPNANHSANQIIDITENKYDEDNGDVMDLFGCCHCVRNVGGDFVGDQIDLRMFLWGDWQMRDSEDMRVKFEVVSNWNKKHQLQILRINQFSSKHQSTSVLTHNPTTSTYKIHLKSSPQKLLNNPTTKLPIPVPLYTQTIKSLSLGGYRSIAFGEKVIAKDEVARFLDCGREEFQDGIFVIGVVGFWNLLKDDVRGMIGRVQGAGIQTRVVTGDDVYIAVQTGVRAGILAKQDKVILLQGKNQPHFQPNSQPRTFKATLLTHSPTSTTESQILLHQSSTYLTCPYPIAIDNDFLTLNPPPILSPQIKIFARISPENKANIVKKYKNILQDQYNRRSFLERIFGELRKKVGMCGDGANDLIAIRESDVGIGLNDTDASYAATFTIKTLQSIDYIIRDSKATITNIVQMIRYYEFISFLKIPSALLMMYDSTYFNQAHVLYTNFTCTIIYPIFQAMGRPSEIVTPARPDGNFLAIGNQMRFWGSLLIATGGLVGGYFYFIHTSDFKPNPNPVIDKTWYTLTYTSTCNFLTILPPFVSYSIFFYIGYPWKQPLFKSTIYFILILLNIIATVVLFYITKYLKKLAVLEISYGVVSVLFGIQIGACFVGGLYNLAVDWWGNRGVKEENLEDVEDMGDMGEKKGEDMEMVAKKKKSEDMIMIMTE